MDYLEAMDGGDMDVTINHVVEVDAHGAIRYLPLPV